MRFSSSGAETLCLKVREPGIYPDQALPGHVNAPRNSSHYHEIMFGATYRVTSRMGALLAL